MGRRRLITLVGLYVLIQCAALVLAACAIYAMGQRLGEYESQLDAWRLKLRQQGIAVPDDR